MLCLSSCNDQNMLIACYRMAASSGTRAAGASASVDHKVTASVTVYFVTSCEAKI
jgi:hypothetical protein